MSIRLMTRVWDCGWWDSNTVLTMLALADWANDDGTSIFPTTATLAKKTRQTERNVQRCIAKLQADGVLILVAKAYGPRPNEWKIDVKKLWSLRPPETARNDLERHETTRGDKLSAPSEGRHSKQNGATNSTERGDKFDSTHITTIEASKKPSTPRSSASLSLPGFDLPNWIPEESWNAFVNMRKKQRVALTDDAKRLIVKTLHALRAKGQDPGAVLDQSTRLCWRDVYPLKKDSSNGHAHEEPVAIDVWVQMLSTYEFGRVIEDENSGTKRVIPKGTWDAKLGPKPGDEGCRVPRAALERFEALKRPRLHAS